MRGKKTGGRRKGTPNKRTKDRQAAAERALKAGVTPLDVMLEAMREALRDGGWKAAFPYAKDAAPYVHPRLAAVVAKINQPGNAWNEILELVDGKSRGLPGTALPQKHARKD